MKRQDIIDEARRHLGTRFKHQGRTAGKACDCAGLIVMVGRALDFPVQDLQAYGRIPDGRTLVAILDRQLDVIAIQDARPGDIYLLRFDDQPQHLAFKTDIGIIHCYAAARKVVEHRIDDIWRRRIVKAYRVPGVKE